MYTVEFVLFDLAFQFISGFKTTELHLYLPFLQIYKQFPGSEFRITFSHSQIIEKDIFLLHFYN